MDIPQETIRLAEIAVAPRAYANGLLAPLYATDAQRIFLRRLLNEAKANRYRVGFDTTHTADDIRLLKSEASALIERLKAAKVGGWPRGEK